MQRPLFLVLLTLGFLSACTPPAGPSTVVAGPPEPAAEGGVILQRACTTCHDLGGLSAYADSWGEPEWRSMVETMIAYGAVLTPAEVDLVSRYLAVNFGTDGVSDDEIDATDTTGMAALLDSACTSCHDLSVITLSPNTFTADEFQETIQRMISYGSPVAEDQVEPLVAYLVEQYGN